MLRHFMRLRVAQQLWWLGAAHVALAVIALVAAWFSGRLIWLMVAMLLSIGAVLWFTASHRQRHRDELQQV